MAPDASLSDSPSRPGPATAEVVSLFHRLNNQLGVILANSELLESKVAEEGQRIRAGLVVTGALEAISTIQQLRQLVWTNFNRSQP